ncbi:biotin-independent malonate decarboxylase subunit beta [Anaeromyxobacter oryzae]|uniref:CoA carboxyltransferase N-terminal domain-containing protein n=1 Tax=Anaeromyxobacter oryzae TaxID=2918170 RepID=A0ABM7X127_9BACT|nr:biotin-independent malonate decarboxylase subunit beta [Anaeromyxobacter oryzae]BDG05498.1 hypothetical protein AMOR_44940 [Anaeromyxobacter oryzae]
MTARVPGLARSFREAPARRRLAGVLDPGTFVELLGPADRITSPHLAALDLPVAFDDGVVVGSGRLGARAVLVAAQEGAFMGGGVGEVHGAKLAGLLARARRERPAAVLLLLDTGGVRLQEANAGLVAVSEVMRGVLAARSEGIPVVALVGGGWGCFGGMGIVARCCDRIAVSEEGRVGLSGPDVIEETRGVEELDAEDRALVWRLYGGKHRVLLGEADLLVEDDVDAFRAAALELAARPRPITLEALDAEHAALARRLAEHGAASDSPEIWRALGVADPAAASLLGAEAFRRVAGAARAPAGARAPLRAAPAEAPPPEVRAVLDDLFPRGHSVSREGGILAGGGTAAAGEVAVVGTCGGLEVGAEDALALAGAILAVVRAAPRRPILLLVDTRGQRMSRRDELLGLNGFLGHLASSIELARRRGHRTVALVTGEAVSAGALALGFVADEVHALAGARLGVMSLPAMARVTKIPVERLEALSATTPVLAPGLESFVSLGAVESVWPPPLSAALEGALARPAGPDLRAERGRERGGRTLAAAVARAVAGGGHGA